MISKLDFSPVATMPRFLRDSALTDAEAQRLATSAAFPWADFRQMLTDDAFAELNAAFPPLTAFERHDGLVRSHGQRPHDRYYLAYETSIYHRQGKGDYGLTGDAGNTTHDRLPEVWQAFIEELKTDETYRRFIVKALGTDRLVTRFAWHVGTTGSEVSPHLDARDKVGTHIFYFNTKEDWREEWGGSILALDGKQVPAMNPDFGDFTGEYAMDIRDNRSFLFKNTADAWHGVRALTCPASSYRRLFNVVFETPDKRRGGVRGLLDRVLR
jgi:hypothetical protein